MEGQPPAIAPELVIDTLQTNRAGKIFIDTRCRTGVAGGFACGYVTDVPYKQADFGDAGERLKSLINKE